MRLCAQSYVKYDENGARGAFNETERQYHYKVHDFRASEFRDSHA